MKKLSNTVWVSTHSRLKAAGKTVSRIDRIKLVSTHSRLKAAGLPFPWLFCFDACFNTQPPEGGWGWYLHLA